MYEIVWIERGQWHRYFINDKRKAEALRKQVGGIIRKI